MNQTRTIRLPIHIVTELNVYLRASRELSQKLDHEPTAEEIAELLEKPVEDVKRMLALNERVTSLDVPLGADSERSVLDTIADVNQDDPAESLIDDDLRGNIDHWLTDLSEKQREVICRRFGLRGHEMSKRSKRSAVRSASRASECGRFRSKHCVVCARRWSSMGCPSSRSSASRWRRDPDPRP